MSVLPSQKLTIGELFVSMAVGLILYLLPNDIRNQTDSVYFSEVMVLAASFVVTAVFLFIIKRYEAVGAALLTNSIITAGAFVFSSVNGILTKTGEFWPHISQYQLITMFVLWIVPFMMVVLIRMMAKDSKDTDESRQGFCRFLVLALRALMIIYILVVVFVQVIPHAPDISATRGIYYMPFVRIRECLEQAGEWGTVYLCWNGLILAPLTFSLLILNPKMRWWQILFISFACGLVLEIFQFSFNTGAVYVDDLILYIAGGFIGFLIKHLIDYIRSFITVGQDRTMLSFDYTPADAEIGSWSDEETAEEEEADAVEEVQALPLGDESDEALDDTVENPAEPVSVDIKK